jgi:SAM-dependent methyltransferase
MSGFVWHDIECGGYDADLPLWEELAEATDGPVLDLGCGTGRVSLHLARRGHEVIGLDLDEEMLAALAERAAGAPAKAVVGDARDFETEDEFALALAPMQLLQLFGERAERVACLSCIAAHLRPDGKAALAIAEQVLAGANGGEVEMVPDVREADGWVYSSLPLETVVDGERIVVRRLRQTVSPTGELSEEVDEVILRRLSAATLEEEAEASGLRPAGRQTVPATDDHVGSTVVVLERRA